MDTNDDSGAEYLACTESIMLYAQFYLGEFQRPVLNITTGTGIVAAHCRSTVTAILLSVKVPNF